MLMPATRLVNQIIGVLALTLSAPAAARGQDVSQRLVYVADPAFGSRQFLVHVPVRLQAARRETAQRVPAVMLLHGQGLRYAHACHAG